MATDLSDVKSALSDLSFAMSETITTVKTDEAHIAEVTARTERRKRELAKLLRSTCAEVRKILTAP